MGQLLNGVGDLMVKDMEKARVLYTSFTSVFIGETSLQEPQALETVGKVSRGGGCTLGGGGSG